MTYTATKMAQIKATQNEMNNDVVMENLSKAAFAIAEGNKAEYTARLNEVEATLNLQGQHIVS